MLQIGDKFHIAGRGDLLTGGVESEHDIPEVNSWLSYGGKYYEVRGVERFMCLMSKPFPGKNIGILVKELPQTPVTSGGPI